MSVSRAVKKQRSKSKITGEFPVVIVYRSNKHISGQIFDPKTGNTIFSANSYDMSKGTKSDKAKQVGKKIAKKIQDLKLDKIVFNRNGYEYKGRVKVLAESIREEKVTM